MKMNNNNRFELDTMEQSDLQKSFALACRILADINGCPRMFIENAKIPDCENDEDHCDSFEQWLCWQKHIKQVVESEQVCRVCGCTEKNACQPYGCSWVKEDLCSACVEKKKVIDGNRSDKSD